MVVVIRSHNPAEDRSSGADSSHHLGHRSSRWQHRREEDFGKGRRRGPEEGMREEDSPGKVVRLVGLRMQEKRWVRMYICTYRLVVRHDVLCRLGGRRRSIATERRKTSRLRWQEREMPNREVG